MSIALIGYGSHARDLEIIAHRCGILNLAHYDDNPDKGADPTLCTHGPILLGINNPQTRRAMALRFSHLRACAPLIDPSAIIGPEVHCGLGSTVAPLASLLHSVTLGDHTHINTGAQMVRTNVGAFCTISPGVVICGDVKIGDACSLGAGAVIADRVTIGNDAIIAAGAIIPPESVVPDGTKVIGVWKQ